VKDEIKENPEATRIYRQFSLVAISVMFLDFSRLRMEAQV
jgi:hypothetical protein